MRKIAEFDNEGETISLTALLESHGIPVHVSRYPIRRGPFRADVKVYLDAQYDDAVALLKDPGHEVADPIDVQAFYQQSRTVGLSAMLKYAGMALLVVAAAFSALVYALFH